MPFEDKEGCLNIVQEPRNVEFTAFLGSFWLSDNQMTVILEITLYISII